jgi:hypothetical protein
MIFFFVAASIDTDSSPLGLPLRGAPDPLVRILHVV